MDTLVWVGQLLLALFILVTLHEFGHFLPAKWFKARVERFIIFFDPWFTPIQKQIGETLYGFGWLPLGGYVKISGMIDESMDTNHLSTEPQPWEFRVKSMATIFHHEWRYHREYPPEFCDFCWSADVLWQAIRVCFRYSSWFGI